MSRSSRIDPNCLATTNLAVCWLVLVGTKTRQLTPASTLHCNQSLLATPTLQPSKFETTLPQ